MARPHVVTCVAPVNIAVIKYWGKRDEKLILPLNDSISTTLSVEHMHTKTTAMASPQFTEDRMWLNGREESVNSPRLKTCLEEIRAAAHTRGGGGRGAVAAAEEEGKGEGESVPCPWHWHVHVCSENNFPTAAGLASSAAGYACLVFSLSRLYGVDGDISGIARRGSGSACRSLYGGFVRWHSGIRPDGSDSVAQQIVPAVHWPQLRMLIVVVSDSQKTTSSTSGMQRSVETSELLQYRASHCVPDRVDAMLTAIKDRDFERFAEITMKDSNQFHAVCLDTYPPAIYMTDTSHVIARLVHGYNGVMRAAKVAYTYDAGPNACLYLLAHDVPAFVGVLCQVFPPSPTDADRYIRGGPVDVQPPSQDLLSALRVEVQSRGLIKYMVHTRLGDGPQVVTSDNCSLLDVDGNPKTVASL